MMHFLLVLTALLFSSSQAFSMGKSSESIFPSSFFVEFNRQVKKSRAFSALRQLDELGLYPESGIFLDGRSIYFSSRFTQCSRDHVVMYVPGAEGQILPRLLYKSLSEGGWRVTPGIFQGVYLKGIFHYTQETKLHREIVEHLESRERAEGARVLFADLQGIFNEYPDREAEELNENNILHNYKAELQYYKSHSLDAFKLCSPGYCFKCDPSLPLTSFSTGSLCHQIISHMRSRDSSIHTFGDYILGVINAEILRLPRFLPNFKRGPVYEYTMNHSLLSDQGLGIHVKVFPAFLDGKPIEWHMARDHENRVWIDRVRFRDTAMTSYGTDKEFLDSGILTNKPLEYVTQVRWLIQGSEYVPFRNSTRYVDITPLLENLLPIQEFRQAEQYKESLASWN